jgi:hypothetical protein
MNIFPTIRHLLAVIAISYGAIISVATHAAELPEIPPQLIKEQNHFKTSKAKQTTFYISITGKDSNNGSLTSPFKSIEKALAVAKASKAKNISIQFRKGTHYISQTIRIRAEDFRKTTLILENFPDEKVIISAGRKLKLNWQPYRDGIYKATIPSNLIFERLYINDSAQPMARYPNFNPKAKFFNGAAADAFSQERVKTWKNPAGGYVHALHSGEWGSFDYQITGKNDQGILTMDGGWQNNRPSPLHKENRFVENIMEELDAPGEWFLDRTAKVLYYYPLKGTALTSATIEVSNLKNTFELKGTADQPLKNVEFKGLNFKHNERTFMDTKEPLLRSDWTIYRGGAVLFDGTANCKVTDCNFTGLGGNAIMLSNYNVNASVTGCEVAYIGASAVCFVGSINAVRSPLFNYDQGQDYDKIDKTPGPKNNDYPQKCMVDNNLFHDLGQIEKQATGVEITVSSEITVSRNTIYNTPRAGINIGDGCFGGHNITFNDVFNTVLETGDHGAFNSWGRDRFWHPNRTYMDSIALAHPELILLDAQKQTSIHDNRFRCDHGWDIDLDDGSSNYHIYNNVCLNGGLKLREGFYRKVENNIMVNNTFHPHVWFKNSGDVFERNIVSIPYQPIRVNDWGKSIDHNLFIDPAGLAEAKDLGLDKNSLTGDPLFVNSSLGDYTVSANSPAFKIGFKNIDMNGFGVQKPELKKLAMPPIINPLKIANGAKEQSTIITFLGAQLKSVRGIGDRSAYGLPDEKGLVVIDAGTQNIFTQSGFMSKDVIRTVNGKPISVASDFLDVYKSAKSGSILKIEIIRNQNLFKKELKIK